jgi:hypothetical protein
MSIADQPDAAPEPDVTDVLNAAADHITRHGLHKGEFFSPTDDLCACVLGTIAIVTTLANEDRDADTVDCEPAAVAFLEYLAVTAPHLVLKLHGGAAITTTGDDVFFTAAGVNLIETVGAWNDAPERTAEQVVDTLRSAAQWAGAR